MAWDLILWLIFFCINIALLASTLYQIICLSDLESDYLNPYESSSRINVLILPEFLLQAVLCALFLITLHWVMFLITLPLTYYNVMLYTKQQHLVDVTEIFRTLNGEKKYRIIKLVFYSLLFCIITVRLIAAGALPVYNFGSQVTVRSCAFRVPGLFFSKETFSHWSFLRMYGDELQLIYTQPECKLVISAFNSLVDEDDAVHIFG